MDGVFIPASFIKRPPSSAESLCYIPYVQWPKNTVLVGTSPPSTMGPGLSNPISYNLTSMTFVRDDNDDGDVVTLSNSS